jgi:hypothetical protein
MYYIKIDFLKTSKDAIACRGLNSMHVPPVWIPTTKPRQQERALRAVSLSALLIEF